MLVYFNIQVTPFVENPTPRECVGLHGLNLHLQSTLGKLQMLFDPDIGPEFCFKTLKGTICLVSVFDNEWLLKFILELSDEFWEVMKLCTDQWSRWDNVTLTKDSDDSYHSSFSHCLKCMRSDTVHVGHISNGQDTGAPAP